MYRAKAKEHELDWVESLTALVENEQGAWSIVTYNKDDYEQLDSANQVEANGQLHYSEVV